MDERNKAARSLRDFADSLVDTGKRLRKIGPRDLNDETLHVVRQAIDEIKGLVDGVAATLDVAKIN